MALISHIPAMKARHGLGYVRLEQHTGLARSTLFDLCTERSTRFDARTLDALCRVWSCQPGDLLEYIPDHLATALPHPYDPARSVARAHAQRVARSKRPSRAGLQVMRSLDPRASTGERTFNALSPVQTHRSIDAGFTPHHLPTLAPESDPDAAE